MNCLIIMGESTPIGLIKFNCVCILYFQDTVCVNFFWKFNGKIRDGTIIIKQEAANYDLFIIHLLNYSVSVRSLVVVTDKDTLMADEMV